MSSSSFSSTQSKSNVFRKLLAQVGELRRCDALSDKQRCDVSCALSILSEKAAFFGVESPQVAAAHGSVRVTDLSSSSSHSQIMRSCELAEESKKSKKKREIRAQTSKTATSIPPELNVEKRQQKQQQQQQQQQQWQYTNSNSVTKSRRSSRENRSKLNMPDLTPILPALGNESKIAIERGGGGGANFHQQKQQQQQQQQQHPIIKNKNKNDTRIVNDAFQASLGVLAAAFECQTRAEARVLVDILQEPSYSLIGADDERRSTRRCDLLDDCFIHK